jgi:hypothetical protein
MTQSLYVLIFLALLVFVAVALLYGQGLYECECRFCSKIRSNHDY